MKILNLQGRSSEFPISNDTEKGKRLKYRMKCTELEDFIGFYAKQVMVAYWPPGPCE